MKGVKRIKPAADSSNPIRLELLHQLIDKIKWLSFHRYTRQLVKTLLLITYHACLRAGEVVKSTTDYHVLTIENISLILYENHAFHIQITLPTYKHSTAPATLVIPPAEERKYCPVRTLMDFLVIRKNGAGPVFVDETNSLVTRATFSKHLKLLVAYVGLDSRHYNTHSLRIGRATDLAAIGVPDQLIKETGRWRSNAFQKYIKIKSVSLPT